MPIRLISTLLFLLFVGTSFETGLRQAGAEDMSQGPASVADLVEKLQDSVVNIAISQKAADEGGDPAPLVDEGAPFQEYFKDFFNNKDGGDRFDHNVSSLGSGFVIDPDGYIVTNNHVIEGAAQITVNFANGTRLTAELVGTDKKTDIALLKVTPKRPLKAVKFGDSNAMRIGDWVMAIGNPFGLGGTVTVGIVSARGRNINAGPFDDFLQTDAAINKGNSGGPLFNMMGDVIGVNTAIISPSGGSIGIGFATPSEIASNVVDQLKQFGETHRGWLGVRIQPVPDDVADSLGLDIGRGALIAGIIEGGPVAGGPLKAGDVITRFNGRDIKRVQDLPRAVAESAIDQDIDVTLLRDGQEMQVTVKLARVEQSVEDSEDAAQEEVSPENDGQTPDEGTDQSDLLVLGMVLSPLDDAAREEFAIDDAVDGVLVRSVEEGSPAATEGIEPGDVIVEVSQEFTTSPDDVAARIAALREEGRRNAQVLVSAPSGDLRFVSILLE